MKRSNLYVLLGTALALSGCSEGRTAKDINVSIPNGQSRCVILFELQSRSIGGPMYWAIHMEEVFESGPLDYAKATCPNSMVTPFGGEGVVIESDGPALNVDLTEREGLADCSAASPLIIDQIARARSGDLGRCAR